MQEVAGNRSFCRLFVIQYGDLRSVICHRLLNGIESIPYFNNPTHKDFPNLFSKSACCRSRIRHVGIVKLTFTTTKPQTQMSVIDSGTFMRRKYRKEQSLSPFYGDLTLHVLGANREVLNVKRAYTSHIVNKHLKSDNPDKIVSYR